MADTMNSRDRMLAALQRKPHDRIPFSIHSCQGPLYNGKFHWRNQREQIEKQMEMGLDPVMDIWMPDVCPAPEVEVKTWREKEDGLTLVSKEFHTPAGTLRQTIKEDHEYTEWHHAFWIPTTWGTENCTTFAMHLFDDWNVSRRTEPWVKGPQDLEALRYLIRLPEGYQLDEWRMDTERAMELAKEYNILTRYRRTIVGDAFQWFCDIPWFLIQFYEDPAFVQEFLDIFQQWTLDHTDLALQADIDVVQHRGWYDIPNYWGTEHWKTFIHPHIQQQAARVHEAGKLYTYLLPEGHGIYKDLLAETDIDCLEGIDPRMLHAGTLKDVYDAAGDKMSFWGGICSETTIARGSRQEMQAAVREAIDALNGNDGLILSAITSNFLTEKQLELFIQVGLENCQQVTA